MFFKKNNKKKKEKKIIDKKFSSFPHLLACKPKENYTFKSNYFKIDKSFACILSFFHQEGSEDRFPSFWGVNLIPSFSNDISDEVVTINISQFNRMTDKWLKDHQTTSENVSESNINAQDQMGDLTSKGKAKKSYLDLQEIANELQNNASYLACQLKLLVKAPTLEILEEALNAIERKYSDKFKSLRANSYMGEQRAELSAIFKKNSKKISKPFYFTSTELAGEYSLVTDGLNDKNGEYIGIMTGDVNNSAVIFDVNGFDSHVIVANEFFHPNDIKIRYSDMWASKIAQNVLINDGKVVHLLLTDCNLDKMNPLFSDITYKLDMNKGDVNMFEMFGGVEDELTIFPSQMEKLILMAEQAYEPTDNDRAIIRGSMQEIATVFYEDNRMWFKNAKENRDKLRIVGLNHNEIPKLEMFCAYLDQKHKELLQSTYTDQEVLHAYSVLKTTFRNLLDTNGDLFNTHTSKQIDGAKTGRRVIYDFASLRKRGLGIAMAQLVNVIGFAVGNLGRNDTLIIHGAESISAGIKNYVSNQIDSLMQKGGRVVYCYNKIDAMLRDKDFNQFQKTDYFVFSTMTINNLRLYEEVLGQKIPDQLANLLVKRQADVSYIRRNVDNVIFYHDLSLGKKILREAE